MKALTTYTAKRFSHLKKLLKKYSSEEDFETLHGIRLEIKKIKAVLQLVNTYVKGFHAHRNFIPLRDIFRKAGKIREPELFYALLLRHEIGGIEDSHIPGSRSQEALSRKFIREIPDHVDAVNTRKDKIEKFLNKVKSTQVKKYVRAKQHFVRLQLQGKWTKRTLHKARKTIKEILYVTAISRKIGGNTEFFDPLQDLIGQWHDKQLLLPVLRRSKNPELERLRLESDEDSRRIRKVISDYYDSEKQGKK